MILSRHKFCIYKQATTMYWNISLIVSKAKIAMDMVEAFYITIFWVILQYQDKVLDGLQQSFLDRNYYTHCNF
jgi:hypothetical protein